MLIGGERLLALSSGPPPQAVLDRRKQWSCLIVLLASISLLRLATLDFIGGILSGLLFIMAVNMTSDGMREMPVYIVVFALLCSLSMLFDAIPLICSIRGRSEVSVALDTVKDGYAIDGVSRTTYKTSVHTTPFFDKSQGFFYNGTSVSMLVSPFVMAFGACLAIHAYLHLERSHHAFLEEETQILGEPSVLGVPAVSTYGSSSRTSFARFQGTAHRLTSADPRKSEHATMRSA